MSGSLAGIHLIPRALPAAPAPRFQSSRVRSVAPMLGEKIEHPELLPGSFFQSFTIVGTLGDGAFGKVYEAIDYKNGRLVAIKTSYKPLQENAESLGLTFCPGDGKENVTEILGGGVTPNGIHFSVIEHVSGEDLATKLNKEGSLEVRKALMYLYQILKGVAYCHKVMHIIHKDIKPGNVVVKENDEVKIADFGTAAKLPNRNGGGTDQYASPEQYYFKPVDERSDLYSVGIMLFQMLTEKHPYTDESFKITDSDIIPEILKNQDTETLSPQLDNLPRRIRILIKRLIDVEPGWRHQSADDALEAVSKLLSLSDNELLIA